METCLAMAATGFAYPTHVASSPSQRVSSAASSTVTCLAIRKSSNLRMSGRADLRKRQRWKAASIVGMAPDDEKMTRRSPLDFPVEWDRPTPGRRPDIFPQFSPMKTPLPPPLPSDPPEEDEEDEEKKEEDPEKEDKPEE